MKLKKIVVVAIMATPLIVALPFITSCNSGSKIKYNAHRGLSSEYFENTKEAFQAAGRSKYVNGIETDVYLTSDRNIICAHAKNPFRVGAGDGSGGTDQFNNPGPNAARGQTDATRCPNPEWAKDGYDYTSANEGEYDSGTSLVYQNTFSQAVNRELWTGVEKWDGAKGSYVVSQNDPNGYGISGSYRAPSFDEYLNICHNYQKSPIIELKNDIPGTTYNWTEANPDAPNTYNYLILINKVIAAGQWNNNTHFLIYYNHYIDQGKSLYESFLEYEKDHASKYGSASNQPVLEELLWEEGDKQAEDVSKDVYTQIDLGHNVSVGNYFFEDKMVKYAHEHKVKICVWTVNTVAEQKKLVKLGVDSITSNFIFKH